METADSAAHLSAKERALESLAAQASAAGDVPGAEFPMLGPGSASTLIDVLEELIERRRSGVDAPDNDSAEPTLDEARANIRAEIVAMSEPPIAGQEGLAALVDAYVKLGGDVPHKPLAPIQATVGQIAPGPVDAVIRHAAHYVANLPGLRDAFGHADTLRRELEEVANLPSHA